ncbi:hypothetical protein F6476_17840 [Pseudomonas umsongensis]|nr:hypothetical protein F6476_17840 [Pseudomonas umsongensis]
MAQRGGPTEQDRSEGTPSPSEGPNARGRALGYLGLGGVPFFQVTRRKGETLSGRYRGNGYAHLKDNHRLSGRLHRQAWLLQ